MMAYRETDVKLINQGEKKRHGLIISLTKSLIVLTE